jgi:hypothetical protein
MTVLKNCVSDKTKTCGIERDELNCNFIMYYNTNVSFFRKIFII